MEKTSVWTGNALRRGLRVTNAQIGKALKDSALKNVYRGKGINLPGEEGGIDIDPLSLYKHLRSYLTKNKASTLFNNVTQRDARQDKRLALRLLRMAKNKDELARAFLVPKEKGLREGWWYGLNLPEFKFYDMDVPRLERIRELYQRRGMPNTISSYRAVQTAYGNRNPVKRVTNMLVEGAPIKFKDLPAVMGTSKLLFKGMPGDPQITPINRRTSLAETMISGVNIPGNNVWTSLLPQVAVGYAKDKGNILVLPTRYWNTMKTLATTHRANDLIPVATAVKNRHLPKAHSRLFQGSWNIDDNPFYETVLQDNIRDRVFKDAIRRGARVFRLNNYANMNIENAPNLPLGDFTGLENMTLTPLSFSGAAGGMLTRRTKYLDALKQFRYALN